MARDIMTTPVIKGRDAFDFYKKLDENRNKKADGDVLLRIEQSVNFFNRARAAIA